MISHVAKVAEVSNYIGSFGAFLTLYYVQTSDQIVICQTAKPRPQRKNRRHEGNRILLWVLTCSPCHIMDTCFRSMLYSNFILKTQIWLPGKFGFYITCSAAIITDVCKLPLKIQKKLLISISQSTTQVVLRERERKAELKMHPMQMSPP